MLKNFTDYVSMKLRSRLKGDLISNLYDKKHLDDLQRLKKFRLFDDDFMTKCFEGNIEGTELVLQIVLGKPDLKVMEVRTQVFVENILNRSVRLDVIAKDGLGIAYNIEVQRADKGAGRKRARYNSSMLDANVVKKSTDFDKIPETYVVFITENDVIGKGKPVYYIERCIVNLDELFNDGSHIVYVNGAYRGNTPIGKLMHDFSCTDPSEMNYKVLADRARFFKESKEGVAIMCKAMEDMRNQAVMEDRVKNALKMLSDGLLPLEKVAEYSELSLEEVKNLNKNIMI